MTETRTNTGCSGRVPLRFLVYTLAVAALAALGLHAVFIAGPAMRAAAHEQVVRAVADEDHQVCERFGIRTGTDAYAVCSRELSIVGQRQVDRDNAAANGIL